MQGRHFVVKIYLPALIAAGIVGANWHTLRHTFASRAVMAGVDIRTVQELMGNSTVTMTCGMPT
jgi:site-specific recombinase XerD